MPNASNDNNQNAIETVRNLIKGIDIAMLTSVTKRGLVSRPMKTQEVEFDGDLWFLTMKDTEKYDELKENPHVNVAYMGKSYVSVRGTAELVDDKDKLLQFWNVAYEKMLQTSSDDPNLVLIKVNVETVEYWETGSPLKMVKQIYNRLTGKPLDEDVNRIVELSK